MWNRAIDEAKPQPFLEFSLFFMKFQFVLTKPVGGKRQMEQHIAACSTANNFCCCNSSDRVVGGYLQDGVKLTESAAALFRDAALCGLLHYVYTLSFRDDGTQANVC
jgi:hypothetical protein